MAMTKHQKSSSGQPLPPPRFVALPEIVLTASARPEGQVGPTPYRCIVCGAPFLPDEHLLGREVPAYSKLTKRTVVALMHRACDTTWLIGLSAVELDEFVRSGRSVL